MILLSESNGKLIKSFNTFDEGKYGFHQLFGFISEFACFDRLRARKRKGLLATQKGWKCLFNVSKDDNTGKWVFESVENCEVSRLDEDEWRIKTQFGNFLLTNGRHAEVPHIIEDIGKYEEDKSFKPAIIAAIAFFALSMALLLMDSQKVKEEEEEQKEVTVVMKEQKTVNIMKTPKVKPTKEQIKKWKTKRAVRENLGFVGMVGSKDMKKVVGGATTKLKKATAGAGQGGDAGSGGEVLVGLGKGVKKTTVGNTGVAGLGGVGTKGKGGGKGGYGDTAVASGEGAGISTIGVAQDAEVDGGLSKYVVAATIQKYLNQIKACYQEQLNKNPGLAGTVTMDFRINGGGRLDFANVKNSSLGSKAVESCMSKRMMTWKFPKPRGGVNVPVTYPFSLRPENM